MITVTKNGFDNTEVERERFGQFHFTEITNDFFKTRCTGTNIAIQRTIPSLRLRRLREKASIFLVLPDL